MDNAQSKRDDLQDQEKRYTDKINLLNDSIQRISEQIGGAKSQREYEAQRKECKRNSDLYIESAKREYASFGEEMISVFPRLMISKIIESASLQIQSCANNDQFVNGINKELIGNLLQRDTCICGNKLTEKEKEKLKSLYQFLPPIGYDELYYGFVSMANNWGKDYNREKLESYIKNALRYLELAREEDEKITKIDALMQEDKQYEKLVVERKRAEGEVEELEKRCLECHDELSKAKMLVNKLKKDIDKASSTVAANKLLDRKIAIMEAVKKYFADLLSDKSQVYSKKLEQTIQSLLNIMLEAKRTVTVSPDFSLRVLDSFDDESKSEGQFATISFAYIGGIFKLLREEEILSNKEYPLVLDAPFSKLGDAPRQKVIDTIPEYAPQIIILSKDNLQKAFGEKIGKVYTITTNTEQNVAEVKEGFLWK